MTTKQKQDWKKNLLDWKHLAWAVVAAIIFFKGQIVVEVDKPTFDV